VGIEVAEDDDAGTAGSACRSVSTATTTACIYSCGSSTASGATACASRTLYHKAASTASTASGY
jgi:hypothetical protein